MLSIVGKLLGAPIGKTPERLRVRRLQKANARRKRQEQEREKQARLMRKLQGRERGHTGYPQIISNATFARWQQEGRKPENKIAVTG